jgi:hypothetical protein
MTRRFKRTTNRCPSSRCASTIQMVCPLESIAEMQPQLQPALLRSPTVLPLMGYVCVGRFTRNINVSWASYDSRCVSLACVPRERRLLLYLFALAQQLQTLRRSSNLRYRSSTCLRLFLNIFICLAHRCSIFLSQFAASHNSLRLRSLLRVTSAFLRLTSTCLFHVAALLLGDARFLHPLAFAAHFVPRTGPL